MTNLNTNNYIPIVGLEIHVELKTKSKMFCSCSATHFQIKPNTHTCPVCLGLPGALPVPNQKAIEWCQLIGLALNCKLAKFSKFDRKNYFYPDLPKGYQISQYDQPFCASGFVDLNNGKKIGITRVHMEEDTAKNVHKNGQTLVDFNRSSVPLVEIVTEPDFRSKEDIDEFLKNLRRIIRYLEVSDANMEKGSMRLELNMSLANVPSREGQIEQQRKSGCVISREGQTESRGDFNVPSREEQTESRGDFNVPSREGQIEQQRKSGCVISREGQTESRGVFPLPKYKVEVKNINSFRYLQKAFDYELIRQAEILDRGENPIQETRGYQEDVDKTISQRSKEDAQDYRYFPDPDIPPFEFSQKYFDKLKSQLPKLPHQKQSKYQTEFKLPQETALFLIEDKSLADYFESCLNLVKSQKLEITALQIANALKNKKYDWTKLTSQEFIEKIKAESANQISDNSQLEPIIREVLDANPEAVISFKAGKVQILGFLIGQIMAKTQGKANPQTVKSLLEENLNSKSN